ncbi:type II secretion system F family protein [Streptomyces sp. 4N509B]|uniref:type II secretion system F family protein n=1 Tax=Streptomyces sp. 4N509B TaxID=3457413 RepID=UPI003FD5F75A
MTGILLLAAGAGAGLWLLLVWAAPPHPRLATLVDSLRATTAPPTAITGEDPAGPEPGWATRLGRPFTPLLRAAGLPRPGLVRDLAITGRAVSTHLADQAALALSGLLLPGAVAALAALGGSPPGWVTPAGVGIALAVAGFLLPEMSVRAEAARQRAAFRHALGAYLDLVHILLAGGSGVVGALHDAADIGEGFAFSHIRRALATAQLTRVSPWQALAELGTELDVRELTELATSVSLAGTEGAKVRASLAAKAAALRTRAGAEAEAAAHTATERMAVPTALLAFGFVFLIVYAAMSHATLAL